MHLFLIAGETSGDRHAAALVRELRRLDPQLQCAGLGGPQMRAAGVELIADLTQHAVVGLLEVVRHLGTLRRLFRQAAAALDTQRLDLVVLVDYPGFNLRFAHEAKRRGIPVVYYVSPQIWAWGAGRLRAIRQLVDRMLVFFPFEEQLYTEAGVPVTWVGHPLLDAAPVTQPRAQALQQYGLRTDGPVIALLPGSRRQEVQRLLPILVAAAGRLAGQLRGIRFLVLQAPGLPTELYHTIVRPELRRRATADITLVPDWDDNLLAACDLALVASGTATLECALLERPMVVVYRTNALTWWIGTKLVRLPYIGLVNVVAGRTLVPECLQGHATPEKIADEAMTIVRSEVVRRQMQDGFRAVRAALGHPGASRRAAAAVLALLKK
ncbi:MAG: lipid-A-disaccharide synthase [Candidatus Omnitrophica bacterium]|nr:lipid-A-disaccharide synthase [Candidatus Omnitrophota bacterium]